MRLPHERFDYSAIVDRRPWKLPRGARIAVWTIVNVEEWDIEKPMPRTVLSPPQGTGGIPDVPNWAWHEYGMRVGIWRLLDVLRRRRLRATTAINASVCHAYAPVARAMRDLGWEFMGHGAIQAALHAVPDPRAAIRASFEALRDFTGRPPRGWLGPGLAETWDTPDLLAEAGFEYVADWVNDDQPYAIRTRGGTLVSIPYTLELGDLPTMAVQHLTAAQWLERLTAQFDRLWAEGARQPRVLALGVHPYLAGAPHRIGYLEAFYDHVGRHRNVWLCTGEELYEWYRASPA
jgi:peptidoglycan/xylan/chitin deacetylase (PgdA/CDA1 family)